MGFFSEFIAWLDAILATYIADNTARIATLLQPAIVTLGVLYIAVWGYLQLLGKIEEPFLDGVKRLLLLAFILGLCRGLWLYNDVIVDSFFYAPAQLGGGVVGVYDAVAAVDEIYFDGSETARLLWAKAGIFEGNFMFYVAGIAVYFTVGLTAVYTTFLLALSKIALSILVALGPLFVAMLFFESTKRFLSAWIAQLANYAFITILTILSARLMLHVISTSAEQATQAGGTIEIVQAATVCLAAALTFLVMKQVPSIAAGLASGVALSSFDAVSRLGSWTRQRMRNALGHAGEFGSGLAGRPYPSARTLPRSAGYALQQGVRALAQRDNTLRRTRP